MSKRNGGHQQLSLGEKRSSDLARRLSVLLLVAALVIACGESDPVTGPMPPTAPSPTPSAQSAFSVSGRVFEHTSVGARPLAGLRLSVRLLRQGTVLDVTSDDGGHYEVQGVLADGVTIAPAPETEYYAPCPPGTGVLRSHGAFDVHVVSKTLLSTTGLPASLPVTIIYESGFVFERTSDGTRPVAGATVAFNYYDTVMSSTLTDELGRFLVCTSPPNTGTDQIAVLHVRKEGYRPASREVRLGFFDKRHIELLIN